MPENKMPQIVDNLTNHLFPEEAVPYRAGKIPWIIHKYLMYVFLATIHGHPVGPHRKGIFRLGYSYWHSIPWSLRKRFVFSSKAFGYEFKVIFDSDMFKKHGYYFNLDGRWKRKMREVVESDKVYELIPSE